MEKGHRIDVGFKYRRAIGTTLTLLDKTMCEFEQWAEDRQCRSVLYSESNRLTTEQREVILAGVAEIRSVLRELKDVLGLQEQVESAAGFIWSQCSGLWAALAEIESKRLKGYGGAPVGFADYFDPKLFEIEEHLSGILDVFKEG